MCHDGELITEQTMVTHHGHTIAEHGQTQGMVGNKKPSYHGQTVAGVCSICSQNVNEYSLARGPQIFAFARMLAFL